MNKIPFLLFVSQKNKMTATNDQYILGQPLSEGQEDDDGVDDDDMDLEWGKKF